MYFKWQNPKYCNQKCYEKSREKYILNCSNCLKKIKVIGHKFRNSKTKKFFCCAECRYEYWIGENNPNYNNKKLIGKNIIII